MFAKSKLSSIKTSILKLKTIVNEKKMYDKVKEDIRNIKSNDEKDESSENSKNVRGNSGNV